MLSKHLVFINMLIAGIFKGRMWKYVVDYSNTVAMRVNLQIVSGVSKPPRSYPDISFLCIVDVEDRFHFWLECMVAIVNTLSHWISHSLSTNLSDLAPHHSCETCLHSQLELILSWDWETPLYWFCLEISLYHISAYMSQYSVWRFLVPSTQGRHYTLEYCWHCQEPIG